MDYDAHILFWTIGRAVEGTSFTWKYYRRFESYIVHQDREHKFSTSVSIAQLVRAPACEAEDEDSNSSGHPNHIDRRVTNS